MRFSTNRFPYVVSKPIHGSQKTISPNEGLISLDVIPNRELESIILSFGDDVEVLAPESLRRAIALRTKRLFMKYKSAQNDCTDNAYLCSVVREDECSESSYGSQNKKVTTDAETLHK